MPQLSVVIPTHRRCEILRRCLAHLASQTIASDLQVVVMQDGEDADTTALLEEQSSQVPFELLHGEIAKSQQGKARNEGVKLATGEYVLFIGDDIFLRPDACESILNTLRSHRSQVTGHKFDIRHVTCDAESHSSTFCVLGYVTWDPAIQISPVMQWLETSGWQFGYPKISQYAGALLPTDCQHRFTYTSCIAVPIGVARAHPFEESITTYGWEDILWGKALVAAGVRLFYAPWVVCLHHHHLEMAESLKRMETLGASLMELSQKFPEFGMKPAGLKLLAQRIHALLPTMAGKHRKALLKGLKSR